MPSVSKKPFFFFFPKQKYIKNGSRGFQSPADDTEGGCITPMVA